MYVASITWGGWFVMVTAAVAGALLTPFEFVTVSVAVYLPVAA
jgi:hypothetical protein